MRFKLVWDENGITVSYGAVPKFEHNGQIHQDQHNQREKKGEKQSRQIEQLGEKVEFRINFFFQFRPSHLRVPLSGHIRIWAVCSLKSQRTLRRNCCQCGSGRTEG